MSRWPVTLRCGAVELRPLRRRDQGAWTEVRRRNHDWLKPWDATVPPESGTHRDVLPSYAGMVRQLRLEAQQGRALPFAVVYEGRFAGQITVGGITWGAARTAYIGYWVDQALAGRGIIPLGVAMSMDYCFDGLGLHRVEINVRPENAASRRVVEKLGLNYEGLRAKYLHIDGDWRDHLSYAICREDLAGGGTAQGAMVARVLNKQGSTGSTPST